MPKRPPMSDDDAYAIGEALSSFYRDDAERRAARKAERETAKCNHYPRGNRTANGATSENQSEAPNAKPPPQPLSQDHGGGMIWITLTDLGSPTLEKVTMADEQWQPIDTAPTSKAINRKVLVSVPNGKKHPPVTMMARYYGKGGLEVAEGYEGEDWAEEINGEWYMPAGWYEQFEGEDAPAHNINPTHWMPLPAPPTARQNDDRTDIPTSA